ncbi:hypothetical protein [Trujillonella humicola]|uniref:hypothetical protein n=1 Tax=Trujillonella humicola TaxID=3383699 RepID=UPI003906B361
MNLKRPFVLLVLVGSLTACGDDTHGPIERWFGDRDTTEQDSGGSGGAGHEETDG